MAGAVHISLSLFRAPCSLTEASDYTLFTFSRLSSLAEGLESSFCFKASQDPAAQLSSGFRGHCHGGGTAVPEGMAGDLQI